MEVFNPVRVAHHHGLQPLKLALNPTPQEMRHECVCFHTLCESAKFIQITSWEKAAQKPDSQDTFKTWHLSKGTILGVSHSNIMKMTYAHLTDTDGMFCDIVICSFKFPKHASHSPICLAIPKYYNLIKHDCFQIASSWSPPTRRTLNLMRDHWEWRRSLQTWHHSMRSNCPLDVILQFSWWWEKKKMFSAAVWRF